LLNNLLKLAQLLNLSKQLFYRGSMTVTI